MATTKTTYLIRWNGYNVAKVGDDWQIYRKDNFGRLRHIVSYSNTRVMLHYIGLE